MSKQSKAKSPANGSMKLFRQYIAASHPVIYVTTKEEARVLAEIAAVIEARNDSVRPRHGDSATVPAYYASVTQPLSLLCSRTVGSIYNWDSGDESQHFHGVDPATDLEGVLDYLASADTPAAEGIYVLLDYGKLLEEYMYGRRLRDAVSNITSRALKVSIVILDRVLNVPPRLENDVTILEWKLPTRQEVRTYIQHSVAREAGTTEELIDRTADACTGLTLREVNSVLSLSKIRRTNVLSPPEALAIKQNIIKKSGTLVYYPDGPSLDSVGGFDVFKKWVRSRRGAFTPEAREYGLDIPKGILLLGVSGGGKSLVAKAVGPAWGMPTLRLDIGRVFGQYVGQSEQRMNDALELAEAIAPCVLWLEEVDKSMGTGGGTSDGGTTGRVMSAMLTWMQEKKAAVFVVATANRVLSLPPELTRAGRFDTAFFVDLPDAEARTEILKIHLNKRKQDLPDSTCRTLADEMDQYSGAEIEGVVASAMFQSFEDGMRPVTAEDIRTAKRGITPLAVSRPEELEAMRNWARGKAQLVSTPHSPAAAARARRTSGQHGLGGLLRDEDVDAGDIRA